MVSLAIIASLMNLGFVVWPQVIASLASSESHSRIQFSNAEEELDRKNPTRESPCSSTKNLILCIPLISCELSQPDFTRGSRFSTYSTMDRVSLYVREYLRGNSLPGWKKRRVGNLRTPNLDDRAA